MTAMGETMSDPAEGVLYAVVVVGGGAGGLNAALVLARARRRVAVVDAGTPRNAAASHMQGFLSRDGMAPASLLESGRAEVAGYGVTLIDGHVERIGLLAAWGIVTTDAHGRYLDGPSASLALQMLVATEGGDAHGEDDYRRWLAEAGYGATQLHDLDNPPQTIVLAQR